MEYLDIYDEYMHPLGKETRDNVHAKGLWHKTVHCWLYDMAGNVYFQIRKDSGTLYTTASGHVDAGETVKEAFAREIKEEIGVDMQTDNASLIDIVVWRMDAVKKGKQFVDRAFANVYIGLVPEGFKSFKFQPEEVLGVVKVNASDCLNLLMGKVAKIKATKITDKTASTTLTTADFLVNAHETGIVKYGYVLQCIINATKK